MKFKTLKATLAVLALLTSGVAAADFGVGVKAGTLGLGVEGRWEPPVVPWFDLRVGVNQYDYDFDDEYAGIDYDVTFALDNYYLTGNFKVPLSPFRLTVGAYSNGNELDLTSKDLSGGLLPGSPTLIGNASFSDSAPYAGVGFDFEVFGKAGLNLDFGVLWQDSPRVSLEAANWDNLSPVEQALLGPLLEQERSELEDDLSDFKAWPVVSLSFIYNF